MFESMSAEGSSPAELPWSEREPDTALVTVLARPPDPEAGDYERLERIGAFERAIAWLQTLQAGEMAEFVQDAEDAMTAWLAAHDPAVDGRIGVLDTVADAAESAAAEIRMKLTLTAAGVYARLHHARALHRPTLAPTATLARKGLLTWPKTLLLIDGIEGLTPAQAERLQAKVLPTAPAKTTGQLRAAIQRFLVGLADPDLPATRRDRKTRTRGVAVTPEADGMATLRAFLPAAAATGIYAVLDQHARGCPATDPRAMDHRRVDALVDLVLRETGLVSEGTATAAGSTASDSTTPGSPQPSSPGPGPDSIGPDAAGPGTTDPSVTTGCVDGAEGAIPGIAPAPPGGSPFVRNSVTVRINITVPYDTLIGASHEPGELAGYGPIPADDARALALDPDSVWTRLLTDPTTGAVLERDTTRYRPPDSTAEFIYARHATCTAPGCRTPAHRCDLDHVTPHEPGTDTGPTSTTNLQPLCRPHHRLKHMPGWHVVLHDNGRTEWTTPSGHRYLTEPSPIGPVRATTPPPRRTGPGFWALVTDPAARAAALAEATAEPPF